MFKYSIATLFIISLTILSCNKSDDTTLSIEEVNSYDDQAIIHFLQKNYFGPKGKVKAFTTSTSDDNFPTLYSLATKHPSGYWIVKNPAVTANGNTPAAKDSIYVLYDLKYSTSKKIQDTIRFEALTTYPGSPIVTTLFPQKNPFFFKKPYNAPTTLNADYYVMEGIRDGLMQSKATNHDINDNNYNFQGVIVAPSRLVYGRDKNFFGIGDLCMVLNFELYQSYPKN